MAGNLSRREAVKRLALSTAVVGVGAVAAKLRFDPGDPRQERTAGERQVRDFRVTRTRGQPVMAIGKSSTDPGTLVK